MANYIPIIDASSISKSVESPDRANYETVGKEICGVFSTVGFLYLKNHGIHTDQVENLFSVSKAFFDLPIDVKQKYLASANSNWNGWVGMGTETLDHSTKQLDLKETYNLNSFYPMDNYPLPDQELPELAKNMKMLIEDCCKLTTRLLKAIGIGLQLDDEDYLANVHDWSLSEGCTWFRSNFYPQLNGVIDPSTTRLGQHADYGTITLLFQDQVGGLEVQHTNGQFLPAVPIEGTIIVNLGECMQRWTSDRLKATVHRVRCVPEQDNYPERQSLAFFATPPPMIVTPLDGSKIYEPINAREYIINKYANQF